MLWKKLPAHKAEKRSSFSWMGSDDAFAWAAESLNMIADASAVAICINLLSRSHVQSVQELILNLIAQLISISEEALLQMLETPRIEYDSVSDNAEKALGETDIPTPLIQTRNNLASYNTSSRAVTPSSAYRNMKANTSSNNKTSKRRSERDSLTCLSIMFSVAYLHRNYFPIMSGCAEIILAMVRTRSPNICLAIAKCATCPLPNDSVSSQSTTWQSQRRVSGSLSSAGQLQGINNNNMEGGTNYNNYNESKSKNKGNKEDQSEWAGLRLLLMFLSRYKRYLFANKLDCTDEMPLGSECMTASQLRRLTETHGKVLCAVCELVYYSPVVAAYVISLEGAIETIRSYQRIHQQNAVVMDALHRCGTAIRAELLEREKKESQQHHTSSYENTHEAHYASMLNCTRRSGCAASVDNLQRIALAANEKREEYCLHDPPGPCCSKYREHERRWAETLRSHENRSRSPSPNRPATASSIVEPSAHNPDHNQQFPLVDHQYDKPGVRSFSRPSTAPEIFPFTALASRPTSPFHDGHYEVPESPQRRGLSLEQIGARG